jgi:anti-anti-sigma factor
MIVDVKANEVNPNVTVVVLGGSLDGLTSEADAPLIEEAAEKSVAGVLFEMSDVEFMSGAALHVLLKIHGAFELAGKKMAFAGLRPAIYKMFKIARLIKAIGKLKADIGIPATIAEAGVDPKAFEAKVQRMAEVAFDDQCVGANPSCPLVEDVVSRKRSWTARRKRAWVSVTPLRHREKPGWSRFWHFTGTVQSNGELRHAARHL